MNFLFRKKLIKMNYIALILSIFVLISIFIIGIIVILVDIFRGGRKSPKLFLKTSSYIILFLLFVGMLTN